MRRRPGLAVIGALLLAGLAGCATAPERLPPTLGQIPAAQVDGLLERWETAWREFQGLRAAVDLTIVRKGSSQRGAGALLLSPTRLRFEAITPLGLPVMVVTADADRLLVLNLRERQAWTGRPTPEAMARWIGLPLSPDVLIRLLTGHVPLPPNGAVRVAEDGGAHLVVEHDGHRERIWITPEGWPVRFQIEGGERLMATFQRSVSGQLLALGLEAPKHSLEVHVRYITGEYIAEPPPEAFEILVPAGVTVERVD